MELQLTKATNLDLPEILDLYRQVTLHMTEGGLLNWHEHYPDESDIIQDIESQSLLVHTCNNQIIAACTLDQIADPEYAYGAWQYTDYPFAVIHRACVHPEFQSTGLGTSLITAAEKVALQMNARSVRLDVYCQNLPAVRLFEKLGYCTVGEVTSFEQKFFLLEKKLHPDARNSNIREDRE